MDSEKLKPCPFCGEQDNLELLETAGSIDMLHYVCCGSCDSQGSVVESKDKAIEAWNNRPISHWDVIVSQLIPNEDMVVPLCKHVGDSDIPSGVIFGLPIKKTEFIKKQFMVDGIFFEEAAKKILSSWLPFPINHPEFTLSKQAQKVYPWCWCKNGEDGEPFIGMFTGSGHWTDNTGKKTDVTHYIVIEKP